MAYTYTRRQTAVVYQSESMPVLQKEGITESVALSSNVIGGVVKLCTIDVPFSNFAGWETLDIIELLGYDPIDYQRARALSTDVSRVIWDALGEWRNVDYKMSNAISGGAYLNLGNRNHPELGFSIGFNKDTWTPYYYFWNGNANPNIGATTASRFLSTDHSYYNQFALNCFIVNLRHKFQDGSSLNGYWWVQCANTGGGWGYLNSLKISAQAEAEDDDMSDVIITPNLPSIDMCDTGFVTIYKPTIAQLRLLASEMWSDQFVQNLHKSVGNPMDTIIAFNIVPGGSNISTGNSKTIQLGNYVSGVTGVTTVDSQFYELDMGSFTFSEHFGNILDYAPYTTISIYFPYIGMIDVSTDDVMNHTVSIKYRCDVVTGQINAVLFVGGSAYSQYDGNFNISVPITSSDWSRMYLGAVKGGASFLGNMASVVGGGMAGNPLGAVGGIGGMVSDVANMQSQSMRYPRGGGNSMTAGYLGIQRCFAVITKPKEGNTVPLAYNSANAMLDYSVSQHWFSGTGFGSASYILVVAGG